MRTSEKSSVSTNSHSPSAGVVQVAIFKEHFRPGQMAESMMPSSREVFYDFSRPLRLLEMPGWGTQIRAQSDDGFFVLSVSE